MGPKSTRQLLYQTERGGSGRKTRGGFVWERRRPRGGGSCRKRDMRGIGVAKRERWEEGGDVVRKRVHEGGCEACIFGKRFTKKSGVNHFPNFYEGFFGQWKWFSVDHHFTKKQTPANSKIIFWKIFYNETNGAEDAIVATKSKNCAVIWWQQYECSRDRMGTPIVNT